MLGILIEVYRLTCVLGILIEVYRLNSYRGICLTCVGDPYRGISFGFL